MIDDTSASAVHGLLSQLTRFITFMVCNLSNSNINTHVHHIHPYFSDQYEERLDETTYKDLIADITKNNTPGAIVNNLPHRDWAPLIKFVKYQKRKRDIFQFFVPNPYNGWFVYVQFIEWYDIAADHDLNAVEAARMLLWGGNIRLHCHCPSYKYHGYQYILTQLDAAIKPENRYPNINNPQLKGVCCKHLRKCVKTLPFHLGTMAKEIKITRQQILRNNS